MNNTKISKGLRLIAFFILSVLLVCTFGFTADGWQIFGDEQKNTQSGEIKPPSEDTVLNEPTDNPPEDEVPKYINPFNGFNCEETALSTRHKAFVMDSSLPFYSISLSDLVIEFPIENDETKLLVFINETNTISKIGSISPTKPYITDFAALLDSVLIADGGINSDYESDKDRPPLINTVLFPQYKYTEFSKYTFTDGNLISQAVTNELLDINRKNTDNVFNFCSQGESMKFGTRFNKITINYSENKETVLLYDSNSEQYSILRNGYEETDFLNDSEVAYDNCFIFFADSATYESSSGTEMTLETVGSGMGYYFTKGTATEITWSASDENALKLYDNNGALLTVNRGRSYISFMKSSQIDKIDLS